MHPDLGGGFGPGFKVAFGYDFIGDNGTFNANDGSTVTFPSPDPRDQCDGMRLGAFCWSGSSGVSACQ